jgi:predicted negative regulator of RcsB-dependent stress response
MANQNSQQGAPVAEEQTLNQSEAFFLKYKKAIIAAVVALVAIIAGVVLYQTYVSGPNEQKASTMLAKGQQYFMAGDYQKALNGDSASYKGFLNVVNEYGSTKAGNLANLYVGLCYANLDKWKEAAQYIEKFSGADDDMVSPAAIGALGNVYAHLNQLDKAVTTLKKAAESADNNSLSPTFLIQAGEILESQGKKDEALKLYQQVKDKYFNSMQYQTIDAYIERVK